MDQIDSFKRTDHYFELGDLAHLLPLNHIDSVDEDAVDLYLELEASVVRAA
ncbi:MAG: hypothetical protein ABIU09_12290 [Pyrinomonadaceae bacterium]